MRLSGTLLVIAISVLIFRFVLHAALRFALRVRTTNPNLREKVLLRYEDQSFYAWMFAILKTWLDPMFIELPDLLKDRPPIHNFLDLGCGFGIAGSFLLELFPQSRATGIDPSAVRVAGASAAFKIQGTAFQAAAPDFEVPTLSEKFDAIFVLDVIHFLSDEQLKLTLTRIAARLNPDHFVIIRANILPIGRGSFLWNCYGFYRLITRVPGYFRSVEGSKNLIQQAGFEVTNAKISGKNPELHWFICTPAKSISAI